MDLDKLKSNWRKSKELILEKYNLNQKEMEAIIKNQSDKTTQRLSIVFMFGISVQSLTLVFQLINLIQNVHLTDFALAISGTFVIVIPALFYSINRYRALHSSDYSSLNIAESLKQKIEFYRFSHNKWLLSFSISFIVFLWSINIITGDITSLQGFSMNLILLYAFVFLFVYFAYRYAHIRYLREYEISLNDLGGKQLTDLHQKNLRFRRFTITLISILVIILLAGILFLFMN